MKRSFALAFFVSLAVGCAHLPADHGMVSLYFRDDPLNHGAQEVIEEIEIVAPSAAARQLDKLPTDWRVKASHQEGAPASCVLACIHQQFAVSDIHSFDGVVSLAVPAKDAPEIEVRLTVTRGVFGPGRMITLHAKDLILK